jgi:hypothetical protein
MSGGGNGGPDEITALIIESHGVRVLWRVQAQVQRYTLPPDLGNVERSSFQLRNRFKWSRFAGQFHYRAMRI